MTGVLDPKEFGQRWAAAWNARDLAAVLEHFHDDVVFTSPVAAQLFPQTGGILRGKEALQAYWSEGLKRIPELHFTVEAVYAGIGTIVINFRNQRGDLVNEVLIFDGELIREGHGTYLSQDDPAGATTEA